MQSKVAILIPARFQSGRFPGKPLATIAGRSMISRVLSNMRETSFDVFVVTDHAGIEEHVKSFAPEAVLRVDDNVICGTDRIHLAYQRFLKEKNYDFIVNVQGDEPLLPASEIKRLVEFHEQEKDKFAICTLLAPKKMNHDDFFNAGAVKVIFTPETGECHYFSRAPIPHVRDAVDRGRKHDLWWYHHVGVYCYRPEALVRFVETPPTVVEQLEKLEQLRGLEIGLRYGAVTTLEKLISVDVASDIALVEDVLSKRERGGN